MPCMEELLAPGTLARLERLVRLARRAPGRKKRGLVPARGRGIEPGARRDYTPGDDLRLLDWPAWARLEKLLVKVTEEVPEPRLSLIIDGSGSMGRGVPSPALRAALAAAGLAACALGREAKVALHWTGPVEVRLALARPGELVRALGVLARAAPGGPGRLAHASERIARRTRERGGAVLLTDGLDPADALAAARRLQAGGFGAAVVLVGIATELADGEAVAALEAGEAVLVAAEGGAERRVPFARLALQRALESRAARRAELEAGLAAAGIPVAALDPTAPFEELALAYLSR